MAPPTRRASLAAHQAVAESIPAPITSTIPSDTPTSVSTEDQKAREDALAIIRARRRKNPDADIKPYPSYQDEASDLAVITSDDWRFLIDKSDLQGVSSVFKAMFKSVRGPGMAERKGLDLDLDSTGRTQIQLVDNDFENSYVFAAFLALLPCSKTDLDPRDEVIAGCQAPVRFSEGYWDVDKNWSSARILFFAQKWDCPTIIELLVRQIDRSLSPRNEDPETPLGSLLIMFTIAAQADARDTCSRLIGWYGGMSYRNLTHYHWRYPDGSENRIVCEHIYGGNLCEGHCDDPETQQTLGLILDPKAMPFGAAGSIPEAYVFALNRAMLLLKPESNGVERRKAARVFEEELDKAKKSSLKRKYRLF